MNLDIPIPNGLPPEGQKQNQTPLDQPKPKPEIKITPEIAAQMPGPRPSSLDAAGEVDKWVAGRVPAQNAAQQEFVELSTEHRHYRIDQIDLLRPTIYEGAAAIIFRYQDRTTGHVQVVILKLDRRDDAVPLARAIAWRRIQVFPFGQFVEGTDHDLTDRPPFDVAQCVDNYFRQQWLAGAKAKLAADKAALVQPLANAKRTMAEQADRITYLQSSRAAAQIAQAEAETKYAQERGRAEVLNRLAYVLAGIILMIIILFAVHGWRA